ncbi:MAG: DUF1707 domain-containing protein [Actinomycetota bacterium]
MRYENRGPEGPDKGRGITRRVGNSERDEAVARLSEHWTAGRLDPGEHELRVTRAKAAVTQADLDALFIDLPNPGSALESTGTLVTGGVPGFLDRGRDTIMALAPFGALALFFTTGQWLWFLMIPVMGILLYGPEGGRKAGRRRSRGNRNRNR